jgi:hypothetical protein
VFTLLAFLLRFLSNLASRASRRAQVILVGDGMAIFLVLLNGYFSLKTLCKAQIGYKNIGRQVKFWGFSAIAVITT